MDDARQAERVARKPAPLAFKPDIEDAARRWDAFYAGDIIDRPIVCVTAPRDDPPGTVSDARVRGYYERVHGDMDDIIRRSLVSAEATFYGGEAVPTFWTSFGPDEIAVFCGAELCWSDDSGDTNWSAPFVEGWDEVLPLRLDPDHPLWRRMLELYRRAAEKMAGKMLIAPLDLHTNMDLLAAVRGPEALCEDLIDRPETIDRAMDSARSVFRFLWDEMRLAGRMDDSGYAHICYSAEGAATLQCDFCCMVSPAMFRRWILPALEEEAEIVRHVVYHWDGPGALVHADDLIASKGLHTLSYVPGTGHGSHVDYVDLFQRVQSGGKAVHVGGSPDQIKRIHPQLRPEKTLYTTQAASQSEAEALLDWFVKHT